MSEELIFAELLSYNIRRLRKQKKLSQLELAIASDLSLPFINSIENMEKWVSAKTLEKLANALNAKPHELFLPRNFDPQNELKQAETNRHIISDIMDIIETYGDF
ncbi:MAG: helix-turn-helix transcriptional regulator [Treponemataceae bacterium]